MTRYAKPSERDTHVKYYRVHTEDIAEDKFQVAVMPDEKISVNTGKLVWPIREISEENIEACVKVIRKSFETVAGQFGFTQENAPRFTAFATDERRIKWHLHDLIFFLLRVVT